MSKQPVPNIIEDLARSPLRKILAVILDWRPEHDKNDNHDAHNPE